MRPCPPPPPRLPPPRSPPPRSDGRRRALHASCGGAGRLAQRAGRLRAGASICGLRCRSLCMAAPDCRDRVPAAACGAGGLPANLRRRLDPRARRLRLAALRRRGALVRARAGAAGFWSDAARCAERQAGIVVAIASRAGAGTPCAIGLEPAPGPGLFHEGAAGGLVVLEELPAIGAAAERAKRAARRWADVGFVARGGLARVGHAPDAVRTAVVADAAVVDVVDHYIVRTHW